jgi:hypothetical protein
MLLQKLHLWALHDLYSLYIYDEKICSRDFTYKLYMACIAYIYEMKKVAPETFPTAGTWPGHPIYMMKNVPPETSRVSTWPVPLIYMMKNIPPETSHRASTSPVDPIYMMKNLLQRHHL